MFKALFLPPSIKGSTKDRYKPLPISKALVVISFITDAATTPKALKRFSILDIPSAIVDKSAAFDELMASLIELKEVMVSLTLSLNLALSKVILTIFSSIGRAII